MVQNIVLHDVLLAGGLFKDLLTLSSVVFLVYIVS